VLPPYVYSLTPSYAFPIWFPDNFLFLKYSTETLIIRAMQMYGQANLLLFIAGL
jgi:hypothetical protein